jgi:uncharacterized protein (TIGR02099 family)
MKRILTRILYYLGLSIAGLIILAAIGLYSLPLTTNYLQSHCQEVENLISHLINYRVEVGAIRVERRGINPEFQFHNVTIYDLAGKHVIGKFDDLYLGISLIGSMVNRRLTSNFLLLSGAKVDLYQNKIFNLHAKKEGLIFILKHVYLRDAYVKWHGKNGKVIVCPNLELQVMKNLKGHKIIAMGDLIRKQTTKFKVIAILHGHDLEFDKIAADGYIELIEGNKADVEAWFEWQKQQIKKLQSRFTLRDIHLRPNPKSRIIYINSLTGDILLQHQQDNTWMLTGNYTNITGGYGNLFRRPIKINKLQAGVDWRHTRDGWEINANNIMVQNADLNIMANANILLPNDHSSPVITALGSIKLKNIKHAAYYYPAGIMSKELLTWLDSSIDRGKGISGSLLWRGRLADFPFHNHKGIFLVSANIANADLKFNPDWPLLQHINGKMLFANDAMQINANATMLNMTLNNIHVVIPDFNKPVLSISDKAEGDNADILDLISQSPLREVIGRYTKEMLATGHMLGNVRFTLPLGESLGKTTIDGKIIETNGILQVPAWQMSLNKLAGTIYFTEDSLHADKLTASFFANPVNIKITTLGDVVRIGMDGKCQINLLQQRLTFPLLQNLSGGFSYRARLDLYKDSKGTTRHAPPNDFNVISNLEGVKITLPQPFGKAENQLRDIYARAIFSSNKPMQLKIRYNNYLSAALRFAKADQQQLKFLNGEIHIGHGLATIPNQPGLFITGFLPEAKWSDWKPYLMPNGHRIIPAHNVIPAKAGIRSIRKVDITVGNLHAFNQNWQNTKLQAEPKEKAWLVQITNDKAIGQLTIPDRFPKQALVAKFNKLYLTFDKKQKAPAIEPADVPPLDIVSDDFHYNNKQFTYVELKVTPYNRSLRINKLKLDSPDFNLSSTADWRLYHGAQHSSLYGSLQTNDAGALLKKWNNTEDLKGGQGNITFSLHWLGAIYNPPKFSSMSGNMLLDFKDGRIINLGKATEEKVDIGRMLNILNPMSFAENITGGFAKKGFAFKEIKGDLKLRDGSIYTDDIYINGNVARVSVQGRIGLLHQDYNLILSMIPNVTSSLPIIAAIFGGPIIGAVTWAGNEVFKHTLQPATMSYKYKVTGSWQKPKFVKIA